MMIWKIYKQSNRALNPVPADGLVHLQTVKDTFRSDLYTTSAFGE